MRQKHKPNELNVDSLLDVLTCTVGVISIVIIYGVIRAQGQEQVIESIQKTKPVINEWEVVTIIGLLVLLTSIAIVSVNIVKLKTKHPTTKRTYLIKDNLGVEGSLAKLKTLISNDNLDDVFKELRAITTTNNYVNELILHEGKYAELKKQMRIETISFENASLSKAKIRSSLLELIEELENISDFGV